MTNANLTQTELDVHIGKQSDDIHDLANKVNDEQQRIEDADRAIRDTTLALSHLPDAKFSGLWIMMLVLLLLVVDGVVAAPALADRFESFGIAPEFAWLVAAGTSVLLMSAEMLCAVSWFKAYERSLTSRRYAAVAGWTIVAALVMSGPVLLSMSQLLIVVDDGFEDIARTTKELALVLLFGGAHALLISSGRYLESAKIQSTLIARRFLAMMFRHNASRRKEQAHNELAKQYRGHLRSVQRGIRDGLIADLGPFEERAIVLIRERHPSVDEDIRKYPHTSTDDAYEGAAKAHRAD